MKKYLRICDSCGKDGANNSFKYLVHLNMVKDVRGFIDNDGNFTSKKEVEADLCNKCYNEIVSKAVKILLNRNPNFAGDNNEQRRAD